MTRISPRWVSAALALTLAWVWTGPALAVAVARDTEIEEFLWEQSRPVFKAAGLDPGAVTIYLVNDPAINAFVAGGQNMFIFTGLIDNLDTPNQLLGVIAHETGHIAGGHLARSSEDMMNSATPFLIGMLAGLAAMLAGEGQAGMGIIMGAQQAMQRAMLGYSRVQESSADQAAISFLDRIGKSGQGMLETFELFAQQELLTARMQDPFARSHPMSRDRLASLQERVATSKYRDARDTPEEKARYELLRAKVRGFMNRPDITLRKYPTSDQSDAGRYARAIAYYRLPDFAGAARAFEKSVALKPGAPLLEVNLGATLVAMEDQKLLPRARDVLESSLRKDSRNAFAWLQLSFAYSRLGNEGMASLAMAEQRFNMGAAGDAIRFAARARKLLPAGSRESERADDIIAIASANAPKDGRGRSRLIDPSFNSQEKH